MRVKRGSNRVQKRKKVLKLAKGYYLTKHNAYRVAKLQVERSLQFAYRDRRQRKREKTRFYLRTMRPEIPAVLEAIKQMGLKIGLISNVNSHGQVPMNLKEYGILNYFHPIVLSSEYGRRKPDPAIFHHAARLANVPTSACFYIGDRISRDIEGAKRAGYGKAILIRHEFEHGENDTGAMPDAVIGNMNELSRDSGQ